jgi:hypothetical protein
VILIGVLVAVLNKRLQFADQTMLITLFVAPLLVLGVASGRIQEFSAPGVDAKFQYVSTTTVLNDTEIEPNDITLIDKGSQIPNVGVAITGNSGEVRDSAGEGKRSDGENKRGDNLPELKTALAARTLVLTLGPRPVAYTPRQVSDHIDKLVHFDWNIAIAILDKNRNFVATADPGRFQLFLNSDDNNAGATALLKAIADGKSLSLLDHSELVFDSVSAKSTNAQALSKMIKHNLKVMVVVDEHQVKGVANRNLIVARLVDKLAN